MSSIPDDIMQTASDVAKTMLGELSRCVMLEPIAGAILAERARCAAIAEDYDQSPVDDTPMGTVMAGQVQVAQSIAGRIWGEGGDLSSALCDNLIAAAVHKERKRCAAIARRKAAHAYDDCECLGIMDPETGIRECSLEVRGGDCLCQVAEEMANEIANEIEGI